MKPQYCHYVHVPAFCFLNLPNDNNDHTDYALIGGGSGVDYGHPHVLNVYEYRLRGNLQEWSSKVDSGSSGSKHVGRLVGMKRQVVAGVLLKGLPTCASTIENKECSDTLKSSINSIGRPVVVSAGSSIEVYSTKHHGSLNFRCQIPATLKSSDQFETVIIANPKESMVNIHAVTKLGSFYTWTMNWQDNFIQYKPVINDLLTTEKGMANNACGMCSTVNSHGSKTIAIVYERGSIRCLTIENDNAEISSEFTIKSDMIGFNSEDSITLKQIISTGASYLVVGYARTSRKTQTGFVVLMTPQGLKQPSLDSYIQISNKTPFTCITPYKGTDDGYQKFLLAASNCLCMLSLREKKLSYRVVTELGGNIDLDDFPFENVMYLEKNDAAILTTSGFTSLFVDLKSSGVSWSIREVTLLVVLIGAIITYVITNAKDEILRYLI